MAGIFLRILVALCILRTVCYAANGDFTRYCRLPTFTGKGYVAFTGEITRLFLEKNNHITAHVHVRNVYRRDAQLSSVTVINAIERAFSCEHQHKLEDVRLWVAKRHSSGFLTAVASLSVTMHMVDEVLKALPDNSFNNGGKFLAFQQGIESCNERNCQYGGVCTVDSSGQSLCQCNIYCTRQYDPVCGTDGNTYNNPCLMRVARCQFQSDITRLRYGQCGATSCLGLKNAGVASTDGEYVIYARSECNTPMKVFCQGMNTSNPKEYVSLPAGVQNNYAYIYAKRLPHRPYSARYKCAGKPGAINYTEAGLTKFRKVRVDLTRMAIIPDDYTFAKTDPFGKRIPYGTAGDCFSMHYGGNCRRGHFKVDLTHTGLRLKSSTEWQAIGFPPGIEMHDYKKSKDGTLVSAKCGGWCGRCRPVGEMLLEQTVCRQEENPCQSIVCEFYSICRRSTDGFSHVCECPSNCSKGNSPVCGSDGKTYENECELQRQSCAKRIKIKVESMTACGVKQPVHLMFAIDTATMNEPRAVVKSQQFFKELGNRFRIPEQGIAHGFLKFDLSGTAMMDFITFYNYIALPAYINTLRSTSKKTTLDQAMRDSVPGLLHSVEHDIRLKYSQFPKAIVLISDGSSVTYPQGLIDLSNSLKEAGIKVVILLVGDADNGLENVKPLASAEDFTLTVGSLDRLKVMLQPTVDKIMQDLDTCRWKRCHFYSKCVKGKEAKCECNRVPSNVDSPVCASDGKTYNNLVALQLAACQEQKWIVPRHRGRCATDPGCDALDCKYYSYCAVPPSGIATCTCPDPAACGDSKNRVCGTDGLSYDNICKLTAAACKRYHEVRVRHGGLCIQQPVDLVFALGGAGSITRDTFQQQKDFIKQFLDTYGTSASGLHVAIIDYGSGLLLAKFQNFDTDNLKDKLDRLSLTAGGRVESALLGAESQLFEDPELVRSYAIKGLIIVTGESINEAVSTLRDAASPLKSKGIKIVAVAVGRFPDRRKQLIIASGEEYIFDFDSNNQLPALVPKVYEVIIKDPCEKKVCPHYAQCVSYDDGRTQCTCNEQCAKVEDPVCGTDGQDYANECVLKATACRESRDVAVADTRPCGACVHSMDIGVILDSSRSVGRTNYETLKRSLAKLTDYFHVSKDGTHFGFIHYNQDSVVDFDFADSAFHNPQALKEKILEIKYDPGRTRTDKAIKMANERLFTERSGARKDVPKFLIVLTDGKTSEDSAAYSTVLAPLKTKGVQVMAVGVGAGADDNELKSIAMGNADNTMKIGSFDQLAGRVKTLTKELCQGIEPLNLVFAINANGKDAKNNFDRMTHTITSIIDSYGQRKINYGLIVYGSTAVSRIQLTERFSNDKQLKNYVKMVQQSRGGADLTAALENAKGLFSGEIPERRNVLVIMTDSKATGDKSKMQPTADELHEMGVKIITVAMGKESDKSELRPLSPMKDNSLKEDPKESPKQLGDRIMIEAIKAMEYVPLVDLGFALSASATDASKNFDKMKSVINSIVDQYSISRIKYGVVVYGNDARTVLGFQQVFSKGGDLKQYLTTISPASGGSSLEKGLVEGKELFESRGARPNARKVLVVFTDKKSTGDDQMAQAAAKDLKEQGIKVITIGLGRESDTKELKYIATDGRHVIPAKKTDDSDELGGEIMVLAFKEIPDVPTLDLAFAISATATDADTNFKLMKDTITSFADMYGMSKINYAVIAYGETPRRWFDFQSQPSDFDALKRQVDAISRVAGVVALDKSLEEARKLFDAARPQARKVLVVITDKKSGSSGADVRAAARPLEDSGITVIPVAIGAEADVKELENVTPDRENIIQPKGGTTATELAKMIMEKIRAVQAIPEVDLGFALSAASTAHNETFQLMKDVINYIIVTYGTQKIHHSVLVYSDTASIEIKFGQTSPSPQQLKTLVENLRVGTGTPNLADALSKAAKMFEDDKRRPLTHKVLVIMADSRSGSTVDDVKTAAKPLMDMDIEVIPVVVGEEADPDELGNTTPDKTNVIETGKDGDPKVVGEKIMDKIRGVPSVPEIDLAFAISATATDADETFSRVIDTTKYIVNKYGTDKIHHGLLVFGTIPSRVRDFRREAFTREEMIRLLDSVPRSSTGPDLQNALDESLKLFEGPGARPTARKVLVVIMDKRSGVDEITLNETANTLYQRFINVIPVAIGGEADKRELRLTTKDESNLIEAPKVFKPDKLGEAIMWKVFKAPIVPDVDLIFAVSATASNAAQTLRTMKDTLTYVLNTYGVGSIRYAMLSFGTDTTVVERFKRKDPSSEDLKRLVQGLPASQGPPVFERVLVSAKNVFEGAGVRPNAMKVVVVITDGRSRSTDEQIRSAAKPLEDKGIHVIAVGIGNVPDSKQLEKITQRKGDVITGPSGANPAALGNRIMEKAFEPVLMPIQEIDLVVAMCPVSSTSDESFTLMKDAVKSIVDKYGTSKIHYGVILYGRQADTMLEFSDKIMSEAEVKQFIDGLPKPKGSPSLALDQALRATRILFDGEGARKNAKKVLVVFTDKSSALNENTLRTAATDLENKEVEIIAVSIGGESDSKELAYITPHTGNIIDSPTDENPDKLSSEILKLIITDPPRDLADLDVAFALSANSLNNRQTFGLMKDTIAWIISNYGTEKLRYSFVVFGADANTELDFDGSNMTPNKLIEFVQSLRVRSGGSNIIAALKKAEEVFDSDSVRPNACKVLVVITDKGSGASPSDIDEAAVPLDDKGIKVVPVAVGSEADPSELEVTNPDNLVIVVPRTEQPKTLGQQIMEHVIRCKFFLPIDFAFALSATGLSKDKIFQLMKDTVKSFADEYGTGSFRYSFIVFSDTANIIVRFSEKYTSIDELKASIEALPPVTGGSSLIEVIKSAKEAFRDSGVRKGAAHVLVVLTDKRSGENEGDIRNAAVSLDESGIVVIPVGVGSQVDGKDLDVITSKEENVILVDENERPRRLMELIIARVIDTLRPPPVDLAFALSATSFLSNISYPLMKDVINTIIKDYGTRDIHYSFIVYGSDASTPYSFTKELEDPDDLRRFVNFMPEITPPTSPHVALKEAKKAFEGSGTRANASKVLVVMTDIKGDSTEEEIGAAAGLLKQMNVKVIAVGIGGNVDTNELVNVTGDNNNVIIVPIDEDKKSLTTELMKKVLKPVPPVVPKIDLVFAISAVSSTADEVLQTTQDAITSIIDKYGTNNIHYGVILFGREAVSVIDLASYSTGEQLKDLVTELPVLKGGPALDEALERAGKMFTSPRVRKDANKILVVITDKKTSSNLNNVVTEANKLQDMAVTVISIGMGSEADENELQEITPDVSDVILISKVDDPDDLKRKMMERILKERRKVPEVDVVFALTATTGNADDVFQRMKDAVKIITDTYGMYSLRYSLIVYGSRMREIFDFKTSFPNRASIKYFIDNSQRAPGRPGTKRALDKALQIIRDSSLRPSVKKVVVLLTDGVSDEDPSAVEGAVKTMEKNGIPVLIFSLVNNPKTDFEVSKTVDTGDLAKKVMEKVFTAVLEPPEIDLCFAVSATAAFANETFTLMTETINDVVDSYGIGKVRYSVVVFGSLVRQVVRFDSGITDPDKLKEEISLVRPVGGAPAIDEALQESLDAFKESNDRPNARKVLVVILDNESGLQLSDIALKAGALEKSYIRVITVGVGGDAKQEELETMASDNRDVLTVPVSVQPSTLSRDIMVLVLTNRPLNVPKLDLVFAISAAGIYRKETFQLMTDAIDSLLQKYDSSNIRYGLIVYDDDATVIVHLKNATYADQVQGELQTIVQPAGGSALDEALETAADMFADAGDRQDADRVLVILTDKSSGLDEDVVAGTVMLLEQMAVKIISVAVGDEVKREEFVIVTNKGNIIETEKDKDPVELSEEIMERVINGTLRLPETNLAFAISATGLEAEETHSFIKEIIKSIIDRHGTERLEFSVIVYGDYASPQVNFGEIFASDTELIKVVGSVPRVSGTPSLEKALDAAKHQFESPYIRPNAAKVNRS